MCWQVYDWRAVELATIILIDSVLGFPRVFDYRHGPREHHHCQELGTFCARPL